MKSLLLRGILLIFCLLLIPSFLVAQNIPYQSAPVNGSTWETTSPTLYWWYVPNPYSAGPFNYSVQVSTSSSNFTSNLIVNATVSGNGAASYALSGLSGGTTYYWRIGVNGNYSSTWAFTPYGSGGGGGTPIYYTITSSAGIHGSISPSGTTSIEEGNDQAYTIIPNADYKIHDVLVDNVSIGAVSSYQFTNVTDNHTIHADFEIIVDTTFVAITGDDTNGDGSRAYPYRTIQHAHNRTDYGGLVYIFNGNYAEDVVLTKPISMIGEANPSTRSFIVRANDCAIKNFDITGSSPGPGIQKVGFEGYDFLENLYIENVDVHNNAEQGILIENMDSITIRNSRFRNNQMAGMAFWSCNTVTIEDVGLEDNLRGMWMHDSKNINISYLYAEDNGKNYPALYPDENGLAFTNCENLTLEVVNADNNEEKGMRFEDCTSLVLNQISASQNKTDGIAFVNCNIVDFNTGFASENGLQPGDHGLEMIKCEDFSLSDFAANLNFHNGIYLGTNYTGYYHYDPSDPPSSYLTNEFMGQNRNIVFENVSADDNGNNGMYMVHVNFGTFNNLVMTNNVTHGLWVDASQHLEFTDGSFDNNNIAGLTINPIDHSHTPSHMISSDEITELSFRGNVSASHNGSGIVLLAGTNTKIVEPLFYGRFELLMNDIVGLEIAGDVRNPQFSGMYFQHDAGSIGMVIMKTLTLEPAGVMIHNSVFDGYTNTDLAILLSDASEDVDARYNIFVGAANDAAVEDLIYHQVDLPALGLVDFSEWTDGKPAIDIGSASAYTGSLVTIPIYLNISSTPLSLNQLYGELNFDETKLQYKYTTVGTGTILNDAGWVIAFDHSTSDVLKFMTFGFNAINSSGTLFYITFEVVDGIDGSVDVTGDPLIWKVDNIADQLAINTGTVNYTASTSTSLVKGDATLDFVVDMGDYIAVINHVNGLLLTGQALLNANVNGDAEVDELDAADIYAYINTGVWPNAPVGGSATLLYASSSVYSDGLLRFPITISNAVNVRSLEIELTYNENQLDYRNFIQLLSTESDLVSVQKVADGKAKLIYMSANQKNGSIVPAEVRFNINGDPNTLTEITSKYSINGGEMVIGPTYGSNGVTGMEEETVPKVFDVSQNYPNPFNPTTTIRYAIPENNFVSIKIYDILGREIKTLVNEEVKAGVYKVTWNGINNYGSRVASGAYIYRVVSGSNVVTKKMLLIK